MIKSHQMHKSSASTFRQKKFLLPFLSAVVVMLMGSLVFMLPSPMSTQFYETTLGQTQNVVVTPEIIVELDERSAITITNSEPPSVELIKGSTYFDNKSTSTGIQTLEINVGDVSFSDMGASFSLETLKDGGRIAVTSGQVEMYVGGQAHLVSAGQQVDFDKNRVIKESSIEGLDVAPWRR